MPRKSFSSQIDAWVAKVEGRATAIFRTAVQRTLEDAQTPVAQGGRLRVDTGFLRGSLAASPDGMPSGPSRPEEGIGDPQSAYLVLTKIEAGDTIWAGWTSGYARPREARDGFLEGAVQRWPQRVAEATGEAKRRIR